MRRTTVAERHLLNQYVDTTHSRLKEPCTKSLGDPISWVRRLKNRNVGWLIRIFVQSLVWV
jgi:hypothetical protein